MAKRFRQVCVGATVTAIGLLAACGSSDESGIAGNGGGAGTAGTGKGGSSASGGGGSSAGGSGGGIIIDSGNGDGSLTDASACAADTQKADPLPLDLYIMLDKSGSMQGSKWSSVTGAIDTFVKDPQSAGLGVGLDFFPDTPECSVGTYSTPSVPIAVLPGNQPAISAGLQSVGPGGGTPTFIAEQGALTYAQTYALQNPTHVVVIVLATDGQPNDCGSNVGNVSGVAAQGVSGTPKVLTFVIGVGSALSNLDAIAQSGGTTKAFIVDTAGNVNQQFIDALNAIRGAALACEYLIPTPEGGVIDPTKVNVQYTSAPGAQPEQWLKYANAAACPPTGGGWYYDNDASPTKILLCPATCDMVKQQGGKGQVDVLFGCKTNGPA